LNAAADDRPAPVLFRELELLARQLEPRLRATLAEEWAQAARFEHASIASFNQFSLELLAVGAPAELLEATNRAALQEVEHARASFALASAYAGRGIGPGPLAVTGLALDGVDLARLARATIREGCVNETLAAAEAACAAENATVPAVCWVLRKIAREESEHAGLAFRFVRWACDVGGAPVREAARQEFVQALSAVAAEALEASCAAPVDGTLLERHGRLSASSRAALRQRARSDLLEPVYRDLFS
jgi:hypothetical protein